MSEGIRLWEREAAAANPDGPAPTIMGPWIHRHLGSCG